VPPLLSLLCAQASTEQQLTVLRSRLVERTPTAPLRQAEAVVRRRHESGPQQA
jgi:hypothetical protein